MGLVESSSQTSSLEQCAAAAGFFLIYALPIGFALSLLSRLLFSAWKFPALLASGCDEHGSNPRLGAWLLFLVFSATILILGAGQAMQALLSRTKVLNLVILAMPIVVVCICALLFAISLPLLRFLEKKLARLDASRQERGKAALLSPRKLLLGVSVVALLGLGTLWFVRIQPRVGYFDKRVPVFLLLALGALLLFPLLWQKLTKFRTMRKLVAGLALCTVIVAVLLAARTRYQRATSMLEIWGETALAGWAIDSFYDVQTLRFQLDLDGIEPRAVPGATHPNVVLITIDTLRADLVSLHGGKGQMPQLTKLGAKAAVFERAFSTSNVTRRALPSMVTGLSPRRVHGRVVGWGLRMDPRHVLLAERLRAGGYDTAGFHCCRSQFGKNLGLGLGLDHLAFDTDGERLAEMSVAWLAKRASSKAPVFLWAHFFEPHRWETDHKPESGARSNVDRYAKSLEVADANLGTLLEGIRSHLGEDTIVLITSDHGEGLGDHRSKNHARTLYDSEIRIPLVIAGPDIAAARIQQPVGLADIAPTILALAGYEPPGMPLMDGRSLAPLVLGQQKDVLTKGEAYAVMMADRSIESSQAAIIVGHFKLIENAKGDFELYNRSKDPKEAKNLRSTHPEVLEKMKARLRKRKETDQVSPF